MTSGIAITVLVTPPERKGIPYVSTIVVERTELHDLLLDVAQAGAAVMFLYSADDDARVAQIVKVQEVST